MRHRIQAFLIAILVSLAVVVAAPPCAQADIVVGFDADYGIPIGEWNVEPDPGVGMALRFGYMVPLPIVNLTPEVFVRQQLFVAGDSWEADYSALIGGIGLRGGLSIPGVGIVPSAFVHVGYGILEADGPDYTIEEEGSFLETGGALDYTALPFVNIGVHGSHVRLFHEDNPNPSLPSESAWMSFGLHVELTL